jgi:hypothetical protein
MRLFFFLNYAKLDDDQYGWLLRLRNRIDVLQVALETASKEALHRAGRWSATEGIRAFLDSCPRPLVPKVVVSMIYGLPGDSLESFVESMAWLHEYPIRSVDLNHLMVLHGTRIRAQASGIPLTFQASWPYRVYSAPGWPVRDLFLAVLFDHWYGRFQADSEYRPVRELLDALRIPFPKVILAILRRILGDGRRDPGGAPFDIEFAREIHGYLGYLRASLDRSGQEVDDGIRARISGIADAVARSIRGGVLTSGSRRRPRRPSREP